MRGGQPAPGPRFGNLEGRRATPARGERHVTLVAAGEVVVEEILSGDVDTPVEFRCDDESEWVVVLEGRAVLSASGSARELLPGDWVELPAGLVHRLEHVEPGTRWLAVRWPATRRPPD